MSNYDLDQMEDMMAFLFDDEPDRTEKAEHAAGDTPAKKNNKRRLTMPKKKFWIGAVAVALLINISITFTKENGVPFSPFESMLVTASFIFLFMFAFGFLARLVMNAPDPEESGMTVLEKFKQNLADKQNESTRPQTSLSSKEQRILEEMEAAMVPKKDQYDVIVFRDIWRFWEKDGRSVS